MSATTATTTERTTWICDNCQGLTSSVRKRCRDCGTSRY